jgi:type VI secretion system protein ImpA
MTILDTGALLRPIGEDALAGVNPREDPSPTSLYYQIKDARNEARTLERLAQQADNPSTAPSPDWGPVLDLAPRLLRELSKDLEVAVWLIEALVREEGYSGLRKGFEVVRGLLETFWDVLHPQPDEEGLATRLAPLIGLNGDEAEGTLIVPIGMVPLLRDGQGPLSAWHYRTAREVAAITDPEARQRRIEAGAVTLERFDSAVAANGAGELFARLREVEECLAEFDALSRALDERCGAEAPPTSSIRQALQDVLECLRYLTKGLSAPAPSAEVRSAEGDGAPRSGEPRPAAIPGEVLTRQDAVEAMHRVREFFRRTEPHSPISYLIDQALRWAQMPLHVLVGELISDPAALESFQLRTGMSKTPSEAAHSDS